MGIGIVGLALTPSYRLVGACGIDPGSAVPALQGFALGGEVGPNAAFLMEAAPPHRRGFFLSIHLATADVAVLVAGIVGFVLSSTLSGAQLDAWGWRVAFLIGASIVPFGLALRRTLEETLPPEANMPAPPGSLRPLLITAGAGMLILGAGTISNYTLDYLTTYAQDTLHMAVTVGFRGDRRPGTRQRGERPRRRLACRSLRAQACSRRSLDPPNPACSPDVFLSELAANSGCLVRDDYGAYGRPHLRLVSGDPAVHPCLAQPRVRAAALSLVYALAIAVFGGTAQLVEKLLIRWTGNPVAPGWYMACAVAAGLVGALLIRSPKRPADA